MQGPLALAHLPVSLLSLLNDGTNNYVMCYPFGTDVCEVLASKFSTLPQLLRISFIFQAPSHSTSVLVFIDGSKSVNRAGMWHVMWQSSPILLYMAPCHLLTQFLHLSSFAVHIHPI